MAKIALISVNDINAEGFRSIFAYLTRHGHTPYLIFLKRDGFPANTDKKYRLASKRIAHGDWVGINEKGHKFRYSRGPEVTDAERRLLIKLLQSIRPQIVGFSVTTPLKGRIAEISHHIKIYLDLPVIWGGHHPTSNPFDSLNYCDFACIGEGEQSILEIANRIDSQGPLEGVKNLAYLNNGILIQNPLNGLIEDLDTLPFKDITPHNKFLIDDNRLIPNFSEISYSHNRSYHIITSRGCIFDCAYCGENYLRKLYAPAHFLRRRSPSHVIAELKEAINIDGFKRIVFEDEVFSFNHAWLLEFSKIYKKEINLPFTCHIYPAKEIGENLALLKEAGINQACLALQSGSSRINKEFFNRRFNKNIFLDTAHNLKLLGIDYYTDVITYNPFEREEDLRATLDVLSYLPKPYWLCVNKLYFLKGTKIYDLAGDERLRRGLPERTFDYYARLFWLARKYDRRIIEFIQHIGLFKRFSSLMRILL